jgi:hypothetical protein
MLFAEKLTGDEIVKRADQVMIGDSAKYDSVMVVKRPKVQDQIYKFRTYFKERGKRVLLRMFAPPREIGKDLLLVDNNMWQFIPNIERSVRIAGTQRFMGGDFNNADLLKVSLVDDYSAELISTTEIEGELCYYLKLRAKSQAATYDRVDYWVRTEGFIPFREAYFTLVGKKMKILTYYDIGRLDNRTRPRRLVMQSSLTPDHLTTINIVRAEYDSKISSAIFTRTYLERKRY